MLERKKMWKELLNERWAKSDRTTIREHTDRLKENLKLLKELYGDKIEKACPERYRSLLWQALELACEYHDWGKLHWAFQREVLKNREVKPLNTPAVKHNLLSPAFLPEDIEDSLKTLVALAIVHHHDAETGNHIAQKIEEVLKKEFGIEIKGWHKRLLSETEYQSLERLSGKDEDKKKFYLLVKGLLLRIDHASSNKDLPVVELEPLKGVHKLIEDKKGFRLNDLQRWVLEKADKNLLAVAPTGYGKTEAGFIFLEGKGFYTIPVRTSANAIYERAKELFDQKVGLLHSSALSYLMEKELTEDRNNLEGLIGDFEFARNFSKPLLVATPDQIFPFVFAFKGFEKYYSLFAYSKVVVDEIQLFEPHTLGFLVEALQKAQEIGSRLMVMTATLPEFVRKDLENIGFEERVFDLKKPRHHLKIVEDSLLSEKAIELINSLSSKGKVLVITNTVKRAVELYKILKEKGHKPLLLHSRYILKERRKKEGQVLDFFRQEEKGICITTQLAEVSLDLSADYLITELSTLDSLFQRLGRVNRRGEKPTEEPNAYVFVRDCSGIPSVYRKALHELSREQLRDGLWTEEEKRESLRGIYDEKVLKTKDPKYLESYEKAKKYIEDLWNTLGEFRQEKRDKAIKLFRDIHSITVVPAKYKEETEELIRTIKSSSDKFEKLMAITELLDYTFSIPAYAFDKRVLTPAGILDLFYLTLDYSQELGLYEIPKDPELVMDNVL